MPLVIGGYILSASEKEYLLTRNHAVDYSVPLTDPCTLMTLFLLLLLLLLRDPP